MKKVILLLIAPLVLLSCSKDDEPEVIISREDLVGVWNIYSINGSTDLDDCDVKSKIQFKTEPDIISMTGSYWNDSFLEEDCRVFTTDHRYTMAGDNIKIENDGIFFTTRFIDLNTLSINSSFEGVSNTRVYKR